MFGSNQFNFETPNVIDPGDLPPSQPSRARSTSSSNLSGNSNTASTHDEGSSGSSNASAEDNKDAGGGAGASAGVGGDYQNDRESAARLLRDIDDLDLSPDDAPVSPRPYDPYDDDEDDEERGHSLPSVEEARMYATRLLDTGRSPRNSLKNAADNIGKPRMLKPPSPFHKRTIQLDAPSSQHLVRKRFMRILFRFGIVLAVLAVTMGIGLAVTNNRKTSAAAGSTATTTVSDNSDPSPTRTSSNGGTKSKPSSGSRQQDVVAFLVDNGISDVEDLNDSSTPQAMAAQWMANVDPLQLDVPEGVRSTATNSRFLQRYVLAVFFYALGGKADGDSKPWKRDYNFLSATDECSWYEETIIADHVQEETALGVTCDQTLQVRNLYMPANELQGSVPSEIAYLTHLDLLALPNNQITGRLPSEMSQLTNLIYFDVKYNQVSGFLPEWIGDLDQLEVLGLSNNQLAGTVPPSFGTLGRLKTLAIDDNALTGSLEFAQHLTNLEYFWADRNLMTGVVDDRFFAANQELRQLDLSFNNLKSGGSGGNGVFPAHLLQHPTLGVLDLSDTSLDGMVLPADLDVPNNVLHYLSLRRSGLEGSIPNAIRNLQALTHLDLFGNSLTGMLPNEMGEMLKLTYLSLGENPYTANQEFPPFLSQLIHLRELSLTSVKLSGLIPSWISYLKDLQLVDLSKNALGGPIPQQLWDLPELSFMLLHDNELTGTVPSDIQGADKLQIVSLYQNKLSSPDSGGDLDHFCTSNPDMDLLAVDCTLKCSDDCCSEGCCEQDDDDCFKGKVPTYLTWYEGMWEFNYTRPSYAYDPAILAEAAVAQIVTDQFAEDQYGDGEETNSYYEDEGNYVYGNQRGDGNDYGYDNNEWGNRR